MSSGNEKSPHILNASSNLLGICFILLTSLKLFNISQKTFIDEMTAGAVVLFMTSCLLSFLSIRGSAKKSRKLEKIAEYFFLLGLVVLFITTLLFSFDIVS